MKRVTYILLLVWLFTACRTDQQKTDKDNINIEVNEDRFSQNFKDRFLCNCLIMGLDSASKHEEIQALSYSDPESEMLYDREIRKILPRAMRLIYFDSLSKVGRVAENAQGYDVYRTCLKYSRSAEMDSFIKENRKTWDTIKNLNHYISDRMLH